MPPHKSMLTKLMMLTTSSNDQEALTAMRKANKLLKDAGVNWEELLKALSTHGSTPPRPPPRPEPMWEDVGSNQQHTNAPEIDGMFEKVFARDMSEGFAEFVESVHIWWKQYGFLTDRQYKAIKKAAERHP